MTWPSAWDLNGSNRPVLLVAAFNLLLLAISLSALPFDPRKVTGISPWIKPVKFEISIVIYLLTLALLLPLVRGAARPIAIIRAIAAATMLIEIVLIMLQAARGVGSHFNNTTPVNAAIFGIMGVAILANTIALLFLLALFAAKPVTVSPFLRTAICMGLFMTLASSFQGAYMAASGAHTVGAPDGGPGIPFFNWSTRAGDLRVAHFLGLHGMQILPLAALALHSIFRNRRLEFATLSALFAGYALFWFALLRSATRGLPFWSR